MNDQLITASVALYFAPAVGQPIGLDWYERARVVFKEHHLSPVLFTAGGGQFELDDCYVLAERGGDLVMWDELLPARQAELLGELRNGTIESVGLDVPRAGASTRSEWRANVAASAISNKCFVGIDEDLVSDLTALTRRAVEISSGLFDLRYGIAYKMPLAKNPASYASGTGKSYSLADFREELRLRRQGMQKPKTADDLWADELNGLRRHLAGLFRGAYPVNVLSEAHVRGADLLAHPIGKLSQLDASLWLWELAESEIPTAQAMLESKKLLVSQAREP
jgi:hypothetical protein